MQRSQVQYCDPFAQRPVDEGARAGKARPRLSSNAPLARRGREHARGAPAVVQRPRERLMARHVL
jgi:hypothetical protein